MPTLRATLNPPRQARSRDTLERLAAAAVGLLEGRSWTQISVAELAAAADTSVGAFYTRFADKDALLDYLDERYADELVRLLRRHVAHARRHGGDIETHAQRVLRSLVRLFRRYRGLIATVVLEARLRELPRFGARTRRMNAELPELAAVLAAAGLAGRALDVGVVRTAMAFTFSALRDQVLFPGSVPAADRPLRDAELTRALVRNFMGYLRPAGPRQ